MSFPANKTYIGDGVYLSFDELQLWLQTSVNSIALEPDTFANLLRQAAKLPQFAAIIKETANGSP